jgi:hypothetical protein
MIEIPSHGTILAYMFTSSRRNYNVLNHLPKPSRKIKCSPALWMNLKRSSVQGRRIIPWLVSRSQYPATDLMDRLVQHERPPLCLHRACAYVPRCTTECECRLVRWSQYPYIENCIDDNVHIALPCSITSFQKVFLCSPPRSNGAFLVEFAKIPLHERLYRA